ncbi:MAG: hypothetical protein QP772_09245 [Actinomycetaceae bacterium UMB1218B]|nr:hypothetical protein [Actinomycetaceae bacterium UMB1218B]
MENVSAGENGAVIDHVTVLGLRTVIGSLALPVIIARIVSANANFALNRKVFHARPGTLVSTGLRYASLAVTLVGTSYVGL